MIIAIDGPAGAGKSTIAKSVARKLKFLYIDTGAMYRALTLKALEHKVNPDDLSAITELAAATRINLTNNPDGSLKVLLDETDVSKEIRHPRITRFVSDIAKIKEVRQQMLVVQRRLGRAADSVLDGRDIGTVVFPDADKKFYLDADFKERVQRRFIELRESGQEISLEDVSEDCLVLRAAKGKGFKGYLPPELGFTGNLIRAERGGIVVKEADDAFIGRLIKKGTVIARIYSLGGEEREVIKAPTDGYVWGWPLRTVYGLQTPAVYTGAEICYWFIETEMREPYKSMEL